jgi:ssDNA-binding Zn-finger/Zn-ribbon topoisomerase 1
MHARTNSRTGQKFWGCTDYPRCTGTRDTDGMSADERRTSMREERGRVRSRWSEDS